MVASGCLLERRKSVVAKRPYMYLACFCLTWGIFQPAHGYEGKTHQQLTFLAAKQFNRCAAQFGTLPLTPLQVRYVAKNNVKQAQQGFFSRLFHWNFYNSDQQKKRSFLWVFDTRLHEQFNDLVAGLNRTDEPAKQYSRLGKAVSYIQSTTSPAHVVPIYYARFWRFSLSDRFDNYPVDTAAIEKTLRGDCRDLTDPAVDLSHILKATADQTIRAVRQPINGLPVTWEAFWKFGDEPGAFGDYGKAGNNFGRKVEFRCNSQDCVLVSKDPIYRRFANARHTQAVKSTISAMNWLQHRLAPQLLTQN